MRRDEMVSWLDALLEARGVSDYCPNGLQVEGKDEIQRVVGGVTACLALIEEAVARGADALLVHHGILWGGHMPPITRSFKRRIEALIRSDMNLIAYHLPLDAHPEVGNGVTVAERLGLVGLAPFGMHKGLAVGTRGEFEAPVSLAELTALCASELDSAPVAIDGGCGPIRRVGVVTGGADRELPQAVEAGLDCYITGEISEYVMHFAREEGIHFIAAGHHATERYGVQALGARLAASGDVSFEFVDVPNPA